MKETAETKALNYVKRYTIHTFEVIEGNKRPTVSLNVTSRRNGSWATKIVQFASIEDRSMFLETLRNNTF